VPASPSTQATGTGGEAADETTSTPSTGRYFVEGSEDGEGGESTPTSAEGITSAEGSED